MKFLFTHLLVVASVLAAASHSSEEVSHDSSSSENLEVDLLELVQKKELEKFEKKNLKYMLKHPELTDEILEKVFKSCVNDWLPACKVIIEECGMRLPQEDVDRALLNHIGKGPLFGTILEATNANPHAFGPELLSAYTEQENQYVLSSLLACPRFDPTIDNNAWIKNIVANDDYNLSLFLADARVVKSVDMAELIKFSGGRLLSTLMLAAHPGSNLDLFNHVNNGMVHSIIPYLKIVKTPDGELDDDQKAAFIQLKDQTVRRCYLPGALLYAAICSGNHNTIQWLNESFLGGKFDHPMIEALFFGDKKLHMSFTAACYGHLNLVQEFLAHKNVKTKHLNAILETAHRANQFGVSDWAIEKIRAVDTNIKRVYEILDKMVLDGVIPSERVVALLVVFAKKYSKYALACPAITRQIIRDIEYKMSMAGLISMGLPMEIATLIAESVRLHPMPITGHI